MKSSANPMRQSGAICIVFFCIYLQCIQLQTAATILEHFCLHLDTHYVPIMPKFLLLCERHLSPNTISLRVQI